MPDVRRGIRCVSRRSPGGRSWREPAESRQDPPGERDGDAAQAVAKAAGNP